MSQILEYKYFPQKSQLTASGNDGAAFIRLIILQLTMIKFEQNLKMTI